MLLVKTLPTLGFAAVIAHGAATFVSDEDVTEQLPGHLRPMPFPHVHMFPEVQLDNYVSGSKDSGIVKHKLGESHSDKHFPKKSAVITTDDYEGNYSFDDGLFIVQNCTHSGTFALEVTFELPETSDDPMNCSLTLSLPSQIYPLPKPAQAIDAYKDAVLRVTHLKGNLNFDADSIDNWTDAERAKEWPTPLLGFFDPDTKDWVSSAAEGLCHPGLNNLLIEVAEEGMALFWYEDVRALSENRFHALALDLA